jgi:hypothetical protein
MSHRSGMIAAIQAQHAKKGIQCDLVTADRKRAFGNETGLAKATHTRFTKCLSDCRGRRFVGRQRCGCAAHVFTKADRQPNYKFESQKEGAAAEAAAPRY